MILHLIRCRAFFVDIMNALIMHGVNDGDGSAVISGEGYLSIVNFLYFYPEFLVDHKAHFRSGDPLPQSMSIGTCFGSRWICVCFLFLNANAGLLLIISLDVNKMDTKEPLTTTVITINVDAAEAINVDVASTLYHYGEANAELAWRGLWLMQRLYVVRGADESDEAEPLDPTDCEGTVRVSAFSAS